MTLTIFSSQALKGSVALPGDKSLSHRAAVFSALAAGQSRVENFLISGVTSRMLDALTRMSIPWKLEGTTLTVDGKGIGGFAVPFAPLNCGNSATTIRFLAGALAASGTPAVLDGSEGLRRRPMDRIIQPLQQMDVNIKGKNGFAPLSLGVSQLPLKGGVFSIPVSSAQVKSCLLLAGLSAREPVTVDEPGFSRDHTERMLSGMGVSIHTDKKVIDDSIHYQTHLIPPSTKYSLKPLNMVIPGDFSSAAFIIVAALITPGSEVTLNNIGLNATRTGLLDVLLSMGASIQIVARPSSNGEPVGDLTVRHSLLKGINISGEQVVRMIDEFPIFAVAAAYAEGTSTVKDASELRLKESDRIRVLCAEMKNLGADIEETADGFIIHGHGELTGGTIDPHGDHRLAMSMAVAGLASTSPVNIQQPEIMDESFPGFADVLTGLGASLTTKEPVKA